MPIRIPDIRLHHPGRRGLKILGALPIERVTPEAAAALCQYTRPAGRDARGQLGKTHDGTAPHSEIVPWGITAPGGAAHARTTRPRDGCAKNATPRAATGAALRGARLSVRHGPEGCGVSASSAAAFRRMARAPRCDHPRATAHGPRAPAPAWTEEKTGDPLGRKRVGGRTDARTSPRTRGPP